MGSTGSMWYTSDGRSDSVAGHKTKKVRPRRCPGVTSTRYEAGSTHNPLLKVPTMAKSTRGTSPSGRSPRSLCVSGVKITPPTQPGPVPTTHTVA